MMIFPKATYIPINGDNFYFQIVKMKVLFWYEKQWLLFVFSFVDGIIADFCADFAPHLLI